MFRFDTSRRLRHEDHPDGGRDPVDHGDLGLRHPRPNDHERAWFCICVGATLRK
jgi:hypothetical protein